MASTKKNNKATPPQDSEPIAPISVDKTRQLRLGAGIFFLLLGVFVSFAIISYFFTWKLDQDKFFASGSLKNYLLHGPTPANWLGRIGAVTSHELVYNGAGIASLAIGFFITSIGLHLIYSKRVNSLLRYLRWVSILLLVIAPILAFLSPHASFPFGGAWGNVTIEYMNGLIGTAGTGLTLLAIACFFLFVVFALDISPLIRRARTAANNVVKAVTPEPKPKEEKTKEATVVPTPVTIAAAENSMKNSVDDHVEGLHQIAIEEEDQEDIWDMTVAEKMAEEALEETDDDIIQPLTESVAKNATQHAYLSFEVITQEEEPTAIITHGAHISIEDNEPYAPELDLPDYKFPTLDLLEERAQETISLDKEELEKNKTLIEKTLLSFGIAIQRISATVGPTVTLYEIVPSEGVRISKIRNLEDDIALNLAALGIRIIAPIPGRGTIGIEVPNANKQIVSMRALLTSDKFINNKMSLPIALGKKIDNENYIVDLATMPHLLMAGATGQGKSVGINAILVSLLYKKHPSHLKFVMVDPKKVELSIYRTIEKHFLAKLPNEEEAIITDTKKVINTLNALCIEMDNRYELLKEAGARNIKEYNEKFISRRLNPENGHKYLPFIVLVIDEFADLIMTAGKEVEMPIARLAQLARAIGIHLIIATQRPSVNVITGTIKANFPARIAFKVSAKVDSRTILDTGGAEQLIGRGDMLVSHGSELLRLQCAFVDTPEVERIVNFIGKQRGYASAFELPEYEGDDIDSGSKEVDLTNRDKLFDECARLVVQTQNGSTSNLQRRLNLGYNRAGRIMDQLEAAGIVGPGIGSKPRDVYIKTEADLSELLNGGF
ncbi:MAG: DNA translocase FtsK [Bacteroidota bacterium]